MATPEYINTLVTKFAAARATRLNLVKQAGMVYDRASTANSALASRGYDNASGSHIFRLDPSYNSLLHPTQLFGDSTVDALDQSWSNPNYYTQNLADYGASAGLGGLAGNQFNKILNRMNFANNGIPTKIPISAFNAAQLSAYVQSLAGDGKGSTRFSVGPNPVGFPRQVGAQIFPPKMPSASTPAMNPLERDAAMREAMSTPAQRSGQTPVTATEQQVEVKPEVKAVPATPGRREQHIKYDKHNRPLTEYQPEVPPVAAVKGEAAQFKSVPAIDWSKQGPSTSRPPIGDQTVQVQSTTPGKSLTGKPTNTTTNQSFTPGKPVTSLSNRANALKSLGWGAALGAAANALKNVLYNNSPFAATKMPVSFDESGNPTPATQRRMDEDAANAGR